MKSTRKWKKASFSTIFWATASILLCTLPCNALVIPDEVVDTVTVPSSDYPGPIDENVDIESGGTLNLLVGGQINGTIGVAEGGTLNLEGGNILYDVSASGEVNIKGGGIGDNGYWNIYVVETAEITVFGTNFSVTGGTIDLSGTYFTASSEYTSCTLTGTYGDGVSQINLIFYVTSSNTPIYLAEPSNPTPEQLIQDLITDVKNLNAKAGIVNSLDAKLQNALDALEAANAGLRQDAVNKMDAFINAVEAQSGKAITSDDAALLIASAEDIVDLVLTE